MNQRVGITQLLCHCRQLKMSRYNFSTLEEDADRLDPLTETTLVSHS